MNVLIIPEDFRNDQYILKSLFSQLFKKIGKPRTRVRVCQDPLLGGVTEALKSRCIREIVELHEGMTDIFILCVDRDGIEGRRKRLNEIEKEFAASRRIFLAENAWEECETWALAGLNLPRKWNWKEVRSAIDVKERFFRKLAIDHGIERTEGGGRRILGAEAARNLDAVREKCREDFDTLARRSEGAIQAMQS